jgi:hypothetical protein
MRSSFVRLGAVGLALLTGVAVAHCGGDDSTPEEIPGDDTGITDETSIDTGSDDTGMAAETSDDTGSMDDTGTTSETGDDTGSAGDSTSDGATSETATDGATTETATDGATADSVATDSVASDSAVADGADAAVVCGTLSATAVDVYVDKGATTPSVGTLACPFHTIKEGTDLAAVAGRTIHVKGGTGSTMVTYTESGALTVKAGVTLLGDGELVTAIVNSATCTGGNCAIQIANGGTIDGFDVTGAGNGIVTSDGTTPAVVRNVHVHDAQDGIVVLGTADFGSATAGGNVQSKSNKANGVHVKGSGTLHVYSTAVPATDNSFSSNASEGIIVEGSARLVFEGGTVNNNKSNGIHLASTVGFTDTARHDIAGLTAKFNGLSPVGAVVGEASGIVVDGTSSIKLRNSVLLTNTQNGITFVFGGTNTINLGDVPVTGAGGNTFSVPDTASQNANFAVCLEGVTADDTAPAEGDKWAACAITVPAVPQAQVSTGNCATTSDKGAVGYKKATGGSTVTHPVKITPVTGCLVGP